MTPKGFPLNLYLPKVSTGPFNFGTRPKQARAPFEQWLPIVTPTYSWQWPHLRYIRAALDQVTSGAVKRLMIFCPPQHGKSSMTTIRYPVWRLERTPTLRVIVGCYNQTLANRFSRQARKIAAERMSLDGERKAVEEWQTAAGGIFRAVGVGAGITGQGGDCLPAGTMVMTSIGNVAIEKLQLCPSSVKIMSYDTITGQLTYKAAQAFRIRQASGLYRITTSSGRVVEATGEHRFWTGRGYTKAAELAAGDSLLRLVWQDVRARSVRDDQATEAKLHRCLLFNGMFRGAPCRQESARLQTMRQASRQKDAHLLREMPPAAAGTQSRSSSARNDLPNVQSHLHGNLAGQAFSEICDILLKDVRGQGAFAAHGGKGQSKMEAWSNAAAPTTPFGQSLSANAAIGSPTRQSRLRRMQSDKAAARSSYRQLADEQRGIQLGDVMREVPHETSCCAGFQAIEDTVALVEQLHESTTVYDIQVADSHNFFANGVLVHNCIIIDDPVKSREEAESQTYRDRVFDWYTNDLYTRQGPNASIILIMTRWHESDLAGRILASEDGPNWTVVNLPAIAEAGDPLGRELGQALCPARYDEAALADRRAVLGSYAFSSLYQGHPLPPGGGMFKREWFILVDALPQ